MSSCISTGVTRCMRVLKKKVVHWHLCVCVCLFLCVCVRVWLHRAQVCVCADSTAPSLPNNFLQSSANEEPHHQRDNQGQDWATALKHTCAQARTLSYSLLRPVHVHAHSWISPDQEPHPMRIYTKQRGKKCESKRHMGGGLSGCA